MTSIQYLPEGIVKRLKDILEDKKLKATIGDSAVNIVVVHGVAVGVCLAEATTIAVSSLCVSRSDVSVESFKLQEGVSAIESLVAASRTCTDADGRNRLRDALQHCHYASMDARISGDLQDCVQHTVVTSLDGNVAEGAALSSTSPTAAPEALDALLCSSACNAHLARIDGVFSKQNISSAQLIIATQFTSEGTLPTASAIMKFSSSKLLLSSSFVGGLQGCRDVLCDALRLSNGEECDIVEVNHHCVQEIMLPIAVMFLRGDPCAKRRRNLHDAWLLPNRPRLVPSTLLSISTPVLSSLNDVWIAYDKKLTQVSEVSRHQAMWESKLVCSPHLQVQKTLVIANSQTAVILGNYDYYHYRIDGFNDDGWGCAYRSLQSVLSWFQYEGLLPGVTMPSIPDIQKILKRVDFGKEAQKNFVGSREWIGSYEVMLVLVDFLPNVECTLRRLEFGEQLETDTALHRELLQHFENGGCPVMIGGSSYAHTILGIDVNLRTSEVQYLILDPHYSSAATDMKIVKQKGWCGWKKPSKFFDPKSFYNLCIPNVHNTDFT